MSTTNKRVTAYACLEVSRLVLTGSPQVVDREWERSLQRMHAKVTRAGQRLVWPTLRLTEHLERARDVVVLRADVETVAAGL